MRKNRKNNKPYSRPGWDEYFLEIAKVVSSRSTCLRRRYGAVIVKDNVIVSTGYNGAPRGSTNCIDRGYCRRKELNIPAGERYELCEAVHAEQNAIINGAPERMKDATIYIAGFEEDGNLANGKPCLLCQRMIGNAMLKEVVYLNSEGMIIKISVNELYNKTHGAASAAPENRGSPKKQ
ncbi:MAG: deoxycytidylate deaminase [Thermodesulfovibrionales bacterium]